MQRAKQTMHISDIIVTNAEKEEGFLVKINPFNRPELNPYQQQPKKAGQELRKNAADQVEISATAKELQKTSNMEAERKARVEQLKMQVQNGDYNIHPKAVAQGIAEFFAKK